MNIFKKVSIMMLLVFTFTFATSYVGLGDLDTTEVAEATSLKADVKTSNNKTKLTTTIDTAGFQIVKMLREIATVILVLVVVWAGYSLFVQKSAEGLADLKGRVGIILVAIAFIFFSEQIVGGILSLFGTTLK